MNRLTNIVNQIAYERAASVGAAPGAGNRARTIRSKKDKSNDPKLQRKRKDWIKE